MKNISTKNNGQFYIPRIRLGAETPAEAQKQFMEISHNLPGITLAFVYCNNDFAVIARQRETLEALKQVVIDDTRYRGNYIEIARNSFDDLAFSDVAREDVYCDSTSNKIKDNTLRDIIENELQVAQDLGYPECIGKYFHMCLLGAGIEPTFVAQRYTQSARLPLDIYAQDMLDVYMMMTATYQRKFVEQLKVNLPMLPMKERKLNVVGSTTIATAKGDCYPGPNHVLKVLNLEGICDGALHRTEMREGSEYSSIFIKTQGRCLALRQVHPDKKFLVNHRYVGHRHFDIIVTHELGDCIDKAFEELCEGELEERFIDYRFSARTLSELLNAFKYRKDNSLNTLL